VLAPDEAANTQCIVGFTLRGSGSFVALLRSKLHKYRSIIRSAVMFHYTDVVNRMGKVGLHSVFWQQSTLYSYQHKSPMRNVLRDLPGGENGGV